MYYYTYSNSAFVLKSFTAAVSQQTCVWGRNRRLKWWRRRWAALCPQPTSSYSSSSSCFQSLSVSRSWRRISSPARSWSEEPDERFQERNPFFPPPARIITIWAFVLLCRLSGAILQYAEVSLRNFLLGSFYAQESPALHKISACPCELYIASSLSCVSFLYHQKHVFLRDVHLRPGHRLSPGDPPRHRGRVLRAHPHSHVQVHAVEHDQDAQPPPSQHAGQRRARHRAVRGAPGHPVQPGPAVLPVRHVRAHMHHQLPARPHQALQVRVRAGQVRLRAGHEEVQPYVAGESGLRGAACVRPRSLHLTWGDSPGGGARLFIHLSLTFVIYYYIVTIQVNWDSFDNHISVKKCKFVLYKLAYMI